MKRILDPEFRYRPSFATDVRETFERIRREQRQQIGLAIVPADNRTKVISLGELKKVVTSGQ
jgi:hypothetical protein